MNENEAFYRTAGCWLILPVRVLESGIIRVVVGNGGEVRGQFGRNSGGLPGNAENELASIAKRLT